MKLFYLVNTIYNSGGMERVLLAKANILAERYGYDVTVVTNHQKGRPSFFPVSPQVKCRDLNVNTHLPFTMGLYLKRLSALIEQENPDIVISLCYQELPHLPKLKCKCLKMGEFHFSHDTYLIKGQRCKLRRMEKAVASLDAFVVLTKEDEQIWRQFSEHIVQIYNYSSFPVGGPRAPLSAKRMISGGRFEKQKNYRDMVLAWKLVHEKHPDWVLDLYGNGRRKKEIARLIEKNGLGACIRLHDATREMKTEMLGASAYLMTSLYEGCPSVLVESAALGLPAVAYRCPCGPAEFIENGKDGFTVAEGDFRGMAERICELIENEALRQEMGARIYEKAKAYTEEKIIPQWDALYRRLVDGQKSR